MRGAVTVVGAGVIGLWQAVRLARDGFAVRLVDAAEDPLAVSASAYAGAMLAPDCEAEAAPEVVRELGARGLALWREAYPALKMNGSLVVAQSRDRSELARFARATSNFERLGEDAIARLEPDLAGRFSEGLLFREEGHMVPGEAMAFLLAEARRAGVITIFGAEGAVAGQAALASVVAGAGRGSGSGSAAGSGATVIDCRGLGARCDIAELRGVRGERLIVRTELVGLSRPVRLLHPRQPIYVVPWGGGIYMVGATVIESEDWGPPTVRSALELMGTAYALHPAFGEAEILDIGAGVRPALPDNVPRVIVEAGSQSAGRLLRVNGAYRHGFLLGPVLAEAVAGLLSNGTGHPLVTGRG